MYRRPVIIDAVAVILVANSEGIALIEWNFRLDFVTQVTAPGFHRHAVVGRIKGRAVKPMFILANIHAVLGAFKVKVAVQATPVEATFVHDIAKNAVVVG